MKKIVFSHFIFLAFLFSACKKEKLPSPLIGEYAGQYVGVKKATAPYGQIFGSSNHTGNPNYFNAKIAELENGLLSMTFFQTDLLLGENEVETLFLKPGDSNSFSIAESLVNYKGIGNFQNPALEISVDSLVPNTPLRSGFFYFTKK
jgi:hypothetical protein